MRLLKRWFGITDLPVLSEREAQAAIRVPRELTGVEEVYASRPPIENRES